MIEHMSTMVVMMILVFVFTIIISVGLQIMNARLIHSSAIEQIQSSYYNVSVDDLNAQVEKGWSFEVKQLQAVNTRRDYEVILHYLIQLPLFSRSALKGTLVGYAR